MRAIDRGFSLTPGLKFRLLETQQERDVFLAAIVETKVCEDISRCSGVFSVSFQ